MPSRQTSLSEEFKLLWRAVRVERSRFIIVQYNHYDLVRRVSQGLLERHPDRKLQRFDLQESIPQGFPHNLLQYSSGFLLLEHFERLFDPEYESERIALNQRRDAFSANDAIVIVFLPTGSVYLQTFAKQLPDLYSVVNPVIQLEQPLEKPERPSIEAFAYDRVDYTSREEAVKDLNRTQNRLNELPEGFENERLRAALYLDQGKAYRFLGEYDKAEEVMQQSLFSSRATGDRQLEGLSLHIIGEIHFAQGDYDTALQYLQQSLQIRREIGDRQGEGATLNNISQVYHAIRDYSTALQYLQQALGIAKEIGDRRGEGAALNNMSQIYMMRDEYAAALEYLQLSLQIQKEIEDRQGEGATLNNIGRMYTAFGDYDTALPYLQQSLTIRQEIGDISGMAVTLHNLGTLYFEQEHFELAVSPIFHAYRIFGQIGSPNAETSVGYLNAIAKKIGADKVKAIIAQLEQNE
ncbi:MAG: tetratricopeptide repeat protein [Phaeodactylibacter sp.]|nr:tetratricopeptide repeat protein [Phaeodactylibacter sp.]